MLGHGVVHSHYGEVEGAGGGHGAQADHPGRGLLGTAEHSAEQFATVSVKFAHEVRPVIHGDLRPVIERTTDMPVVELVRRPHNGIGRHPEVLHEGRCSVILGAQGVAGAESEFRSARSEHPHQVRRLGGDV